MLIHLEDEEELSINKDPASKYCITKEKDRFNKTPLLKVFLNISGHLMVIYKHKADHEAW